ncbi:NADH-quinone oxidoreductase subunit J [Lolliginicoccus suaedae]|uniref:NADH-quinone oxidoreductase subunit J n=1 Tax=Lolliginicoccus suaedae TaxID=2605429 RepID=UPI0011F008A5|nr:NADH-quinone oxidoreductase subunit J [Lolliginicoccus suaedae]
MNLAAHAVDAEPLLRTTTGEAVQFWVLAAIAVTGAIGVVASRRPVHSALFLATTMITLAILYIAQGALFLGVAQIVVYTGAVMMLFLFVLMLIGVESSDSFDEPLRGHRVLGIIASVGFGLLLIAGIGNATLPDFVGLDDANSDGNVPGLAELLFLRYVWVFELTGALLIIATLGAMLLAHRELHERRKTQREMSIERFQEGHRATPRPAPGVYARHNAVDMPARLPDGSYARGSVSRILRPRDPEEET